ncbi:M48 family metallopeptidase [Jannaschia pohangensis]|uniref:Peptidase family M48 n=1 Tax=Jannaschia pohangensis TaxID=390807 RepID=A0A1I3LEF0_9RHOB|nr:M48 family metallopeptidase [Jannaschia pohangensis]SFI83142.1 Peptidase family M48 [Jannaschia pohangensis]
MSDFGSDAVPVYGDFFDGDRALKQRVRLTFESDYKGHSLRIDLPDGTAFAWPVDAIRQLPDQAPGRAQSYGISLASGSRVVVSDDAGLDLMESLGRGLNRPLNAPRLWPRAILVSLAGAAMLSALIFAVLPAMAAVLARFMNPTAEVAMGEEHYQLLREAFGGPFGTLEECTNPEGQAALDRMVDRVSADVDLPYPLQVVVLDDRANPVLNAFAVAGGRITFFNSLIQLAESPEEVAAVLAHELGHVVHDDPVRHTLQSASSQAVLAVLIGDLTGGGILTGVAGQALTSNYSRGAETRADDFAHGQLTATGLPPSALGSFFERARDVWGEAEGLVAHFSSHPQLAARIEASAGVGDPDIGQPALTPKDWQALRDICG